MAVPAHLESHKNHRSAQGFLGIGFLFSSISVVLLSLGAYWLYSDVNHKIEPLFGYFLYGAGFQLLATIVATGAIGKYPSVTVIMNWSLFFIMLLICVAIFFMTLLKFLNY